jgi:CRAL/TRIO domain
VYGLIKLASQIGSDYYPEIMGNMFVVNAPYLFAGVWTIVKGFIDERTRNKIKIMGSGFEKTLLEFID